MHHLRTNHLRNDQKAELIGLRNAVFPAQLELAGIPDFEAWLNRQQQPEHSLLLTDAGEIAGWICWFTRDADCWFSMLVASTYQGKGLGSQLLDVAKIEQPVLNGWVVDHDRYIVLSGAPYLSPLDFYRKNEFVVLPNQRLEVPELSAVKVRWERQSSL